MTLNELAENVERLKAQIKQDFSLAGMEVMESPYIPKGIVLMQSRTQMAIANTQTGKITIVDLPDTSRMPIKFQEQEGTK